MRTLAYAILQCRRKFGKSDLDLENGIADYIKDELRQICSSFPYWFLKIEPGMLVPSLFSSYPTQGTAAGTLLAGNWLDQGWLRTEPGVDYCPVYTAQMANPVHPQGWGLGEVASVAHVKQFSNNGNFQADLEITDSSGFLAQGGLNTNTLPAGATTVWPHTVDGVTYLRFHPSPTEYTIYSVSYQLALPPWVQVGTAWSNLILQYYPKLILGLCGQQYAEWFHEPQMAAFYKQMVSGDTDYGAVRSDIPNWGIIGHMKADTNRRLFGEHHETGHHDSISAAIGRDGYEGRGPSGLHYNGPSGF